MPGWQVRYELVDRDTRGMYLLVSAANPGQGTFFVRYKDSNGKTCHQKIGRTAEIDLAEARKRAKRLKSEINLGADPRGEVKAQKEIPTLDRTFMEFYAPYASPGNAVSPATRSCIDCGLRTGSAIAD